MKKKQISLHKQAQSLFSANKLREALAIYEKLYRLDNKDVQAWHMAGAIAGMMGDYASARSYCEKVITLNPNNHGPYLNLANVLMATGNFQESMLCFEKALQLKPGDPQSLTNLANLYTRQGQLEPAINCLQHAIRAEPGRPEAYNNLGNLYRDQGHLQDAESCFRKALNIQPNYVDALCNLGATLSDQLKFAEAKECYIKALQFEPRNIASLRNLGDLYQSTGEFEKAKTYYEDAHKHSPSDISTISSLAALQERCGDKQGALDLLTPLITSGQYDADSAITYAKLCSAQDNDNTGIQVLSNALKAAVSPNKTIDIHFALGDLYDHSGQYEQAFNCFKMANDMDSAREPEKPHTADLKPIANFFNRQQLDTLPKSTCLSELPIFIVGMPRTGTSLVEQILASHSLVTAGGERGDIFSIIDSLNSTTVPGKTFPESLECVTQDALDDIATEYLESIQPLAGKRVRFTDKTPLHGMHLGFISQLLPNSRIILCNRNALDTCLSIYFHRFNAFHGYAKQLDTLGTFYREYYALMRHWISILDLKILSIQYEDLVRDPEQHIRNIIEFCGLEWESNCLNFHLNKRTLNTPSYAQVRKPMYTKSVARWKHYNKHLEPLKAALEI